MPRDQSMGRPGFHVMGWMPCTCGATCALTDADLRICQVNCAGKTTELPVLVDVTLTLDEARSLWTATTASSPSDDDGGFATFTSAQSKVYEAIKATGELATG